MPKVKTAWRFRKASGGDPVKVLSCGCKVWVYDKMVVRYCPEHLEQQRAVGRALYESELSKKI